MTGDCPVSSILPEAVEPARVHLAVPGRVRDLPMPEVSRQGPRVDALVDRLEAGGMAQQVRMDPCHADALGRPCERLEEAVRGQRRTPLGDEDKARSGLLLPA